MWTEFYSEMEQRWIHMDACENAFDKPHLYEARFGINQQQAQRHSQLILPPACIAHGKIGRPSNSRC